MRNRVFETSAVAAALAAILAGSAFAQDRDDREDARDAAREARDAQRTSRELERAARDAERAGRDAAEAARERDHTVAQGGRTTTTAQQPGPAGRIYVEGERRPGRRGASDQGFYIGGGVGDFSGDVEQVHNFDPSGLTVGGINLGNLLPGGNSASSFDNFELDDTATRLFGGWHFNRYLAFQLDLADYGESRGFVGGLANPGLAPLLGTTAKLRGATPSIVGTLPIGPIELFGRAGMMFYDLDFDIANTAFDDSDRDPVYAAGVGLDVLDRFNLRLEYEMLDIATLDDAKTIWLNAAWKF